ncbi:Permease of the drug/metabolite transporter (DMT) superfamily [Halobacillus karajensis]|uniref:DMT superfamily transporter inner membrane protein n=1 Tax=Halobacillus karajensis TaxID=195088 RepID=A0A024PAS3_9BACI|nr:DMT family transporter [Halobacillus karajensis]CDQ21597.1 putative DMT superfamily transporter inner membrane protein [Halobacillus karajensis]CDQ25532.1 putative DMT superfamily transporter inner membrane protein [Halobacillus karajensis]CDQ28938.1 putative DMT superfamily transporter inner membrane protein [Halobacillus karajensis]SEI08637.1 Permease of the drug/metabolite transporter (DMT) superfamily [Halobacillus karajensis]
MKLYASLLTLSLIWGLSFVFIETLIGTAGVWGTVFFRCFAGVLILLPLVIYKWMNHQLPSSIPWKVLLVVGVFNAGVPWGMIALSQTVVTSNMAAVLNALTPIMTGLIGFLVFSVRLNLQQWGGIVLGFGGIIILTGFDFKTILSENFIGIGTMILATSCYGFVSHFTRKHLRGFDVILLTTVALLVGAGVGLFGVVLTQPTMFNSVPVDMPFILSVVGLGCVGSGIAHLLFYYMIDKGGAEFASMVTYLVPVSALFWGHFLLGEAVTSHLIIGLAVIFTGVFLSTRKRRPKPAPSVDERVC